MHLIIIKWDLNLNHWRALMSKPNNCCALLDTTRYEQLFRKQNYEFLLVKINIPDKTSPVKTNSEAFIFTVNEFLKSFSIRRAYQWRWKIMLSMTDGTFKCFICLNKNRVLRWWLFHVLQWIWMSERNSFKVQESTGFNHVSHITWHWTDKRLRDDILVLLSKIGKSNPVCLFNLMKRFFSHCWEWHPS